ncbi:cytochrome c oxidase assembly protein COX16 homolog, mitochondrial-like [Haliotis cracherodii]|uniref:cytochrome c oxidase assembly protein COX16 homolog, mitochondrial-like n=1 Tax=Haliotis cracherodii TaxID=6455 RepID=UPI0039E82FAA
MSATNVFQWLRNVSRRRFIRLGAPFLLLIVGGSFGLEKFTVIRYQFRKGKKLTEEEAAKHGLNLKETKGTEAIEKAYEKLQRDDLDNWQNVRGPRPWEDSKTVQDLQRQNKVN